MQGVQQGPRAAILLASRSNISYRRTEIADSAVRQSAELARVTGSFANLDTLTQQNAAMVEESNAAAHQLARAAEELRQLVSRFRTSQFDTTADRMAPMLRVA